MKRCPSCCESKPLDQFYRSARNKDGHQLYCKPCGNAKRNAWKKANRAKESEWAAAATARLTQRERKNRDLRRKFKMSVDDYEARLAAQGGVCAVCGEAPGGKTLHVDHDHACCTGRRQTCGKCTRGLLCFKCNAALGNVNDSQETLWSLIAYLEGQLTPNS